MPHSTSKACYSCLDLCFVLFISRFGYCFDKKYDMVADGVLTRVIKQL